MLKSKNFQKNHYMEKTVFLPKIHNSTNSEPILSKFAQNAKISLKIIISHI